MRGQFPIYSLRHVFCTRVSEVALDAVVQRAMRHTSPETKRHYQLGMAEQVRQAVDKANKRLYGPERNPLRDLGRNEFFASLSANVCWLTL